MGDFETNSMWKAVEKAMTCVSLTPTERPTMSEVVVELKECLASALAQKNHRNSTTYSNEIELCVEMTTEVSPLAR